MLKARDRIEGVMIRVKKEGKKDGKAGQSMSVKSGLKTLNFSL